ncbi:enoyl-CoA hydratase-related protein [Acinetobacter baumannii]|uniref:enoyl-CoA hydratase-related protein n=2 Tax=Acinetobacter baumannii TaxID=470 RepID=UPI00344CE1FA
MSPSSSGHVNMMKGQPFHVKYREIIRRMSFLIGALLVFRLGAHIPVPGINNAALENLFHANQGTILGLFNMFSGGALERMSILALGIMPYISASIIVQLMSTVIPSLEALKKEGEQGKRKINQYTRQGTLLLAVVQAVGMCAGLIGQGITLSSGLAFYIPAVTSLVAGTMFLMWLGEQITERGIGNGISMIIFAGIVAGLPKLIMQSVSSVDNGQTSLIGLVIFGLLSLGVLAAIVFIEKAQRRIPVNYAQKQQGRRIFTAQQTHLPLKINMAGVIPAQIAPFVVKRIGLTQARRLALLGMRFEGHTALSVGVVHQIAHNEIELEQALQETIQHIKRAAPQASRVTKALLHRTLNEPLNELLDDAAQQFAQAVGGAEGQEGTMAFIQKRLPNWADGS